jgi:type I restriction enzyme R subunit
MNRTNEAAFETVIEAHLLQNGYVPVAGEGFDHERAFVPEAVLTLIRETQRKDWAKLEALHGERAGEQILGDLEARPGAAR